MAAPSGCNGMKEFNKKLIEVALPLPEINDASAYDKMPGMGAPEGRPPLVGEVALAGDPSGGLRPGGVRSGRHPDRFPHRGGNRDLARSNIDSV